MDELEDPDFFDRYDRFVVRGEETGAAQDPVRFRHRYEAIISRNRELFQDARVLNIHSGDGRWCMAALNAGAVHVVGVEHSRRPVEAAKAIFTEYGIAPESYQFVNSEINAALRTMTPEAFDLVVCQQLFQLSDPRVLFGHIHSLRPKHVILDTDISRGEGPIVRFTAKLRDESAPKGTRRYGSILTTPNHELITFLCEYFGFRWRLIDWRSMGITDWTGVHDYERDRRRTYVLDRL